MSYEIFEDLVRVEKKHDVQIKTSPYCDLMRYKSSVNPELTLSMLVLKPAKPSYILVTTHGWHMSIPEFKPMDQPQEGLNYLKLQVDMRGRAFSEGSPDCNGWELYDVIDAVNFAKEYYKDYIKNKDIVYFEGGSGGGGNAFSIIGKFPDFFAAATALCGATDYADWYGNDKVGEFRDDMSPWIGCSPEENPVAYQARSGLYLIENLQTPLFIAHGQTDKRIPATHSRNYVTRAKELKKDHFIQYLELPGVGAQKHWEFATEEQIQQIADYSEQNRQQNRNPIELPDRGTMIVAGYLVTRKFSVRLDTIDRMAKLDYDLIANKFDLYELK